MEQKRKECSAMPYEMMLMKECKMQLEWNADFRKLIKVGGKSDEKE